MLLHITDSIKAMGPVWATWAFPIERFCGLLLLPAIKSHCFPYANLDQFVTEGAQLLQIKLTANLQEVLAFRPQKHAIQGQFMHDSCKYFKVHKFTAQGSHYVLEQIQHMFYYLHIARIAWMPLSSTKSVLRWQPNLTLLLQWCDHACRRLKLVCGVKSVVLMVILCMHPC